MIKRRQRTYRPHFRSLAMAGYPQPGRKRLKVSLNIGKKRAQGDILRPISPAHVRQITDTWMPHLAGQEDERWNWAKFADDYPDGRGWQQFVLLAEARVQGAIIIGNARDMRSPANTGAQGCYIEYLATAPWNRVDEEGNRIDSRFGRIAPVGKLLMAHAIVVSLELGHEGRMGWHSKNGSIEWYEKTFPGIWCGGPDATEDGLPYYEIGTKLAQTLAEEMAPFFE
jgi:hypothetical protein